MARMESMKSCLVVLPHVLAELATTAPNLSIASTGISEDTFDHLKTGQLDLALSGQESLGTMRTEKLFEERFVLVTRADHPLAAKTPMSLEGYLAWPHALIDIVHSRLYGIDRKLEKIGKPRRVALRVPHMLAAPFFAQSTDLIVPVPERIARMYATIADNVLPQNRAIFRTVPEAEAWLREQQGRAVSR